MRKTGSVTTQQGNEASLLHVVLAVILAFHIFFGGIVVERMTETYWGLHKVFFVYRAVSIVVMIVAVAWLIRRSKPSGIPHFLWLLVFMLALALVVGTVHGRSPHQMASHAMQAMVAILGFLTGYLCLRGRIDMWRIAGIFSVTAIVTVLLWMCVYIIAAKASRYDLPDYSLNFYVLIIPFAYFIASGRGLSATLTFALMILIGKRAIMLAGVAMMAWQCVLIFFARKESNVRRLSSPYVLAIVALAALRIGGPLIPLPSTVHLPSTIGAPNTTPAAKDLGRSVAMTDLNSLSSFRGNLIESVVTMLNGSPIQWLTGAGLGSSFIFNYSKFSALTDGVDLMPLHLIMLYGAPLTLVVFIYLSFLLTSAALSGRRNVDPLRDFLSTTILGFLACSMFTYVSIDPSFWLFVGALSFLIKKGASPDATPACPIAGSATT